MCAPSTWDLTPLVSPLSLSPTAPSCTYRLQYQDSYQSVNSTILSFGVEVVVPTNVDIDGLEEASCERMSLDWMQIQICECVCA